MDSIRKCGLHPPRGEPLDVAAVKEILIEFAGRRDNPAWNFERRSTVPVQEEIEDINSASSDSLSPDLGEVWQYGCPHSPMWDSESDCSEIVTITHLKTGPSPLPHSRFETSVRIHFHFHDIWYPMLASLCHFEVGVVLEALLDEVDMGRIALACHFFGMYCAIRHILYLW